MEQSDQHSNTGKPEPISVIDIFIKGLSILNYIKSKWRLILVYTIVGALAGLAWSVLVKPKYTAVCTFVLEESDKEGMLSQYSGLASLAGVDLGSGGGGIFKGDNIIELYKSRLMIKKTLLTTADYNGKKTKLIDQYINFNNLRQKWRGINHLDNISFEGDPSTFNRTQDSIIFDIAETFNKRYLDVNKPDKKLSIINVSFTAKNEVFARAFTDKLVENVNDFYVQTKTKKSLDNVKILQHQADSVKRALNLSINGVASAIEAAPLANPILTTLHSSSQKRQVDVQSGSAVYGEIIKNLEMAKLSLRQQTPLIQFIDQPEYPLYNNHIGKVKGIVVGAILGFLFILFSLLTLRLFTSVKNSVRYKLNK